MGKSFSFLIFYLYICNVNNNKLMDRKTALLVSNLLSEIQDYETDISFIEKLISEKNFKEKTKESLYKAISSVKEIKQKLLNELEKI